MNQIEETKKKRQRRRKLSNAWFTFLKYSIGYPLHYLIEKPVDGIKLLREYYYSKRFSYVEKRAIGEMKQFLLDDLASTGACAISYKRDEDSYSTLSVEHFLRESWFDYGSKGRKFSMLYGKLFKSKIEKNKLKYTNDLVTWLLDQELDVTLRDFWNYSSKEKMIVAKVKK